MDKNKNTTSSERKVTWECFQKDQNISEVVDVLGVSCDKINNAV